MLIHRIAAQLYTAEGPKVIEEALERGEDATLAVSQSGRTLMVAAQFARRPRPTVYIVSGEDQRTARIARSRLIWGSSMWLDSPSAPIIPGKTLHPTMPWWRRAARPLVAWPAGNRACGGLGACAAALAPACRRSPIGPQRASPWVPRCRSTRCPACWLAWAIRVPRRPTPRACSGCTVTPWTSTPPRQRLPCASSSSATRSTAYAAWWLRWATIGDEDAVEIYPCRELALTDDAVKRISAALYLPAQNDTVLAAMLELAQQAS